VSDSKAVSSKERDHKRTGLATFLRQVIAELRKVVWPTQSQLSAYFAATLVFVVVVMLIVAGLDLAFGKLAFWVFGGAGS